jgi:hypothetical protein
MWLTHDGGPGEAASRAESRAFAVDASTIIAQSPIASGSRAQLASLETGEDFPLGRLRAASEPVSLTAPFSERFAFGRSDGSAQASISFDERFGSEGAAFTGAIPSAAAVPRVAVARAATPRVATSIPIPQAAPKRSQKAGFQLASASETAVSLGYAPADTGIGSGMTGPLKGLAPKDSDPLEGMDTSHTAIYDITAHTVYMPNGRRLEAHSGLGSHKDDPRSVAMRNTGATPPNVYDLRMRESLFHGVRALRLIPKDGSRMYGRSGILAHSYMLGPNGQSNGCVSFDDYPAFLEAYLQGDVTRLVVVEHLANAPSSKTAADWFTNTLKDIFRRS